MEKNRIERWKRIRDYIILFLIPILYVIIQFEYNYWFYSHGYYFNIFPIVGWGIYVAHNNFFLRRRVGDFVATLASFLMLMVLYYVKYQPPPCDIHDLDCGMYIGRIDAEITIGLWVTFLICSIMLGWLPYKVIQFINKRSKI